MGAGHDEISKIFPHQAPPGFGTVIKGSDLQELESLGSSHGKSAYNVPTAPKKVPGAHASVYRAH